MPLELINADAVWAKIKLNPSSFVPYYEQISEQIRALIKTKELRAGQEFCSEGDLAKSLGISKMPVRQAFQKLRSEGILTISKGKRPLIGSDRVRWDFHELRGFSEEMLLRGFKPSAKVLSIEVQAPNQETAQSLQLEPEQKVYYLKRLRFVDDQPVAVVTSYLSAEMFPGLEKLDLASQSLYHVIENIYHQPLQSADEVIGAVNAALEEAHILQTAVGSALLSIREVTFNVQQIPVEYSISLLRGDRYTAFMTTIRRK